MTDELAEFVGKLLDDWEADEEQIFSEWGVGQQEYDAMAAEITARRAEWERIRATLTKETE